MVQWSPGVSLEELEKKTILEALRHFRGNKTQTASSLGIAIRTLDNKLEKYETDAKKVDEEKDARIEREREFQKRSRGPTIAPKNGLPSGSELSFQSTTDTTTEQPLPVPVGQEVQGLPPKAAPANRPGGRR